MVHVRFALSDAAIGRYALAHERVPNRIYFADLGGMTLSDSLRDRLARLAVLDATSDWPTYNLVLGTSGTATATYFVADDVPSTTDGWEALLSAYAEAREQEPRSPSDPASSATAIARMRRLLSVDDRILYEQVLMGLPLVRDLIGVAPEASIEALLYQLVRERYVRVATQHDVQRRQEAKKKQEDADKVLIQVLSAQVLAEEAARHTRNLAEEARWIAAYGSPRLKKLHDADYPYVPLYVMERAHFELPFYLADVRHWVAYEELDPDEVYTYDSYIPSEAALAEAARVHGRIVRMYGLDWGHGVNAPLDYKGIAIMVEDYLGICNLFLPWNEQNPSTHP